MFYPLRWVFYEKLLTIHEFDDNDIVGNDDSDSDSDDATMDGLLMGCCHGLHNKFRGTSLHINHTIPSFLYCPTGAC